MRTYLKCRQFPPSSVFSTLKGLERSYLRSHQHDPIKIIRLPILNRRCHDYQTQKEDRRFEDVKIKLKVMVEQPAKENHERKDQHGDLEDAVDDGSHNQIHLASSSHACYGDAPRGVPDWGDEDKTDECFVDFEGLGEAIDAADKVEGAEDRTENRAEQNATGSVRVKSRSRIRSSNVLWMFVCVVGLNVVFEEPCSKIEVYAKDDEEGD
jgi:hypothetical protein